MVTAPTTAVTDDGSASSTTAAGATRSYVYEQFRRHFRNSEDLHERSELV